MVNKKTLKELGEEYEKELINIKRRIADKRRRLASLRDSVCSTEAYELKRELQVLYAQHREASEIADYLKSYYEPHEGKRELFEYK